MQWDVLELLDNTVHDSDLISGAVRDAVDALQNQINPCTGEDLKTSQKITSLILQESINNPNIVKYHAFKKYNNLPDVVDELVTSPVEAITEAFERERLERQAERIEQSKSYIKPKRQRPALPPSINSKNWRKLFGASVLGLPEHQRAGVRAAIQTMGDFLLWRSGRVRVSSDGHLVPVAP